MSLTIGTFNIRQRSFTEGGTDTGDHAWGVRLPEAADYVVRSGAALLALQEVDFSPAPSQSAELAAAVSTLTGSTWAVVDGGSDNPGSYLYDTSQVTHLIGGGPGYFEPVDPGFSDVRRCAWAKFSAVGVDEPFWLLRTHFPTSGAAGGEVQAMYSQAASIVADRADILAQDARVVIVGDFNDATYARVVFAARGYTDIRDAATSVENLALRTSTAWDETMTGRQDGAWIDGMFLSAGWSAGAAAVVAKFADGVGLPLFTPPGSDHLPISAALSQVPVEADDEPVELPTDTQVRVRTGSVVTGDFGRDITDLVSACSWSVGLNATGSIDVTIPLDGMSLTEARELRAALAEGRSYIAITTGPHVIEAGPIQSPGDFDPASTSVRIKALGLRSMFEARGVVRASVVRDVMDGTVDDGMSVQRDVLHYSGLTLGTIAKRLVQNSLAMPGGDLPIAFRADEVGTGERSYEGFKLLNLARELDELTNADGGPDIELRPRFRADGTGLEWELLTGTEADPLLHQAGEHWEWDLTVPQGPTAGLAVKSETSRRTNMAWTTGEGQDKALRMSVRTNDDDWEAGYPLRESVDSYPQESVQEILQSFGDARIRQGSRPMTTWTVVVRPDHPALGEFRPGDWARLTLADHPWEPDGEYRVRISGFDGALGSDFVRVTFLPMLEAR